MRLPGAAKPGTGNVRQMPASRIAAILIVLAPAWVCAGAPVVADHEDATGWFAGRIPGETAWDRAWELPTLYRSPANPVLQELAFTGQIQTQYAYGSESSGNYGTADLADTSTWGNTEVRRFRIGLKAKMFGKLSFLNLTDLNPDFEPRIYKRTPETYFTWAENAAFNLSVGKSELKFDREQEFSSKEFPLFERTSLGNMFYGGELTGIWATGKGIAGGWLYHLGLYGNDRQDEWPEFNGGMMILGKIGYNYSKLTNFDLAELKFQLLHNTEPGFVADLGGPASPLYSNCVSVSQEIKDGPFGLTVEALWGDGENGRPDAFGISAVPFWNVTENIQWISDFELAASPEENGIFLPTRYETLAPGAGDASGDGYFAAYTGLTYYIRGHNLKLMSGVKYTRMHGGTGGGDFDGWTWLAGVRMAF
jgi:phosphate-selective porin OprO and OprP